MKHADASARTQDSHRNDETKQQPNLRLVGTDKKNHLKEPDAQVTSMQQSTEDKISSISTEFIPQMLGTTIEGFYIDAICKENPKIDFHDPKVQTAL